MDQFLLYVFFCGVYYTGPCLVFAERAWLRSNSCVKLDEYRVNWVF